MKLLFLTPQLPFPPRQGTTIRNWSLLRRLADHHTLFLFSFLAPGETLAPDSPLTELCARVETCVQPVRSPGRRALDTVLAPVPDMGLRMRSRDALHRIQCMAQAEAVDIVQAEGIEMGYYGATVAAGPDSAFVFDEHNAEYVLQKRAAWVDLRSPRRWPAAAYSLVQWQKLRRYEATLCRRAGAVVAVSEIDRSALANLVPGLPVTVIPNGIDLHQYPATPESGRPRAPLPTLVFTGKMDYRPNVDAVLWFGRHVFPLIQARRPKVRFQIVGMNPSPRLAELRCNGAIEITGAVEDTRPYVQEATVYVVPMRVGGGTRFKVLEAFACAKPLVSTSLGVEGIPVRPGSELLVADSPPAFAQAVLRLIDDQEQQGTLSRHLGVRARRLVEAHYDWDRIVPRLDVLYAELLQKRSRS